MTPDLSINLAGIRLKNPVLAASGTFGYGTEYADLVDVEALGVLHEFDTAVIVNVAGSTVAEYVEVARRLNECNRIDGLEINISCPNVKQGGALFGSDPKTAAKVVAQVRKATSFPLVVKLTPNVTDIVSVARAVEDAGADALSLINTLVGMAIDVETKRPKLANGTGGLSGPAIKPVALAMVWKVAQAVNLPVVGIGGILSAEDALEFLIAGATAVQVGTGNFVDPRCMTNIIQGLEQYCQDKGIDKISEIVGTLEIGK
ncbi:MAG: dihydroorotate dehydrogenase [Candidatus Latescibacteria bacterium 4484_181]|nr:MAG: dihydroorotate dehydrogenase [Candidatus Latescibacteria bacterium 4484_181]